MWFVEAGDDDDQKAIMVRDIHSWANNLKHTAAPCGFTALVAFSLITHSFYKREAWWRKKRHKKRCECCGGYTRPFKIYCCDGTWFLRLILSLNNVIPSLEFIYEVKRWCCKWRKFSIRNEGCVIESHIGVFHLISTRRRGEGSFGYEYTRD